METTFALERADRAGERVLAGYLARLAPQSRETMLGCLARIAGGDAREFAWHRLRREHTLAIRLSLVERFTSSPATANKYLAALRGVLREAWRAGVLPGDDYARAVDLPPVRGNTVAAGRALDERELAALFGFCSGDGVRGSRNAAMLVLLYGGGLRVGEAVSLTMDGIAADLRSVSLRGKGARHRTTPLLAGADRYLEPWLRVRNSCSPHVLQRVRREQVDGAGESLSIHAAGLACEKLARRACVARFTPHDLRRTFATQLEEAGVSLAVIQEMMGHSDIRTTEKYLRIRERRLAAAAARVSLP